MHSKQESAEQLPTITNIKQKQQFNRTSDLVIIEAHGRAADLVIRVLIQSMAAKTLLSSLQLWRMSTSSLLASMSCKPEL